MIVLGFGEMVAALHVLVCLLYFVQHIAKLVWWGSAHYQGAALSI